MEQKKRKLKTWHIVVIIVVVLAVGGIGGLIANITMNNDVSAAMAYIESGNLDSAKEIIDRQLKTNSSQADVQILLADYYVAKKEYLNAINALDEGISKVSDKSALESKKAEIESKYGDEIKAAQEAAKKEQEKAAAEAKKEQEKQAKQTEKAQKQKKEDFIKSCKTVSYEELARNTDKYKGKNIVITVQISQVIEGGVLTESGYRAYEDYNISAGNTFLQNEWYVRYELKDGDTKILKDDIVEFYGTFDGTQEMERALTGIKESVPTISVKYYKIKNK